MQLQHRYISTDFGKHRLKPFRFDFAGETDSYTCSFLRRCAARGSFGWVVYFKEEGKPSKATVFGMRAKGKILFDDTTVVHPAVEEAKRSQRQKQEEIRLRREARPEKPLLNRDRYPNLYAEWIAQKQAGGTSRQPKCPVCREATLHWDEPAHECPGFKPMFEEHDQDWHDRKDAEREAIREAKRGNGIYCDGCGQLIEDADDAAWHDEYCEHDPESNTWRRHHVAVNGDEDDLSGYEDEPEDDWCDEDDGDPMWE